MNHARKERNLARLDGASESTHDPLELHFRKMAEFPLLTHGETKLAAA